VITLNGATFAKGLGAHAASEVRVSLAGTCRTFAASVGVDDEVAGRGSVTFEVWSGATRLFNSGTVTGTSPSVAVDVDVSGVAELRLVVTDAGDGIAYDHGSWGDARLVCEGGP
jgi:alpha-galactosidase